MPKTIAGRLKVKFGDVRAGFAIFSREKGFCRKSVRLAAGIFQEGRANCDGRKRKTGALCGFFDGESAGGPNQEFAARPWRGRSCPSPQAAERFAARGVCGRFFHLATVGLWTTQRYSASFGASRQDFVSRTVPILIRCSNQSAFRLSKPKRIESRNPFTLSSSPTACTSGRGGFASENPLFQSENRRRRQDSAVSPKASLPRLKLEI